MDQGCWKDWKGCHDQKPDGKTGCLRLCLILYNNRSYPTGCIVLWIALNGSLFFHGQIVLRVAVLLMSDVPIFFPMRVLLSWTSLLKR